ncbi:Subunit of KEOPS complex Cgi121 [Methanonatronarchaeum thermophilum]|uniref:Subunit of KEOPS complex Cgi121 n=1 Tax=Methanonatronarchaeum thermophilum TaxID=1927129 RepID=A0A1Y3GC27_9EURY|nr:KEOPS complex subunit Cgi121 [Methanonatronarchaeum thermophilum]OUJ19022.1 Subunit of KEOPS complex Cgi121 [Methanonatronarchaeum thermophilum]
MNDDAVKKIENSNEVVFKAGVVDIEDINLFLEVLDRHSGDGVVQAVDAGIVAGEEHLRHATLKAINSWKTNPISQSLGMEILLYIVGERQINKALEKAGVAEGSQEIVLVGIGEVGWSSLIEEIGLELDSSLINYNEDKLNKICKTFGIPDRELEAVGKMKTPYLVLERVTLLDTKK